MEERTEEKKTLSQNFLEWLSRLNRIFLRANKGACPVAAETGDTVDDCGEAASDVITGEALYIR